jgi:ABC-type anion transport system duplicated permease subunit
MSSPRVSVVIALVVLALAMQIFVHMNDTISSRGAVLGCTISLEEVRVALELLLDLRRVSVIVSTGCIANLATQYRRRERRRGGT